jgi:hypothetical protein
MVRAVMQTLEHLWASDLDLGTLAKTSARLSDLALIQQRVRASLPPGAMLPPDARDAALARIHFAPAFIGSVMLERLVDVDMVAISSGSMSMGAAKRRRACRKVTNARSGTVMSSNIALIIVECTPAGLTATVFATPNGILNTYHTARSTTMPR